MLIYRLVLLALVVLALSGIVYWIKIGGQSDQKHKWWKLFCLVFMAFSPLHADDSTPEYQQAKRNSRELIELYKKHDYMGMLARYKKDNSYWQPVEKRYPNIGDANQTLKANCYRELGHGKEAAAEFAQLAKTELERHHKDKAMFWVHEAMKDDPSNPDIPKIQADAR